MHQLQEPHLADAGDEVHAAVIEGAIGETIVVRAAAAAVKSAHVRSSTRRSSASVALHA